MVLSSRSIAGLTGKRRDENIRPDRCHRGGAVEQIGRAFVVAADHLEPTDADTLDSPRPTTGVNKSVCIDHKSSGIACASSWLQTASASHCVLLLADISRWLQIAHFVARCGHAFLSRFFNPARGAHVYFRKKPARSRCCVGAKTRRGSHEPFRQ